MESIKPGTHPNLPKGKELVTGRMEETHPNLPKGKELDTGRMDEKPILTFIRDWCRTKGRGRMGEGNERLLTGGRSLVPFGI